MKRWTVQLTGGLASGGRLSVPQKAQNAQSSGIEFPQNSLMHLTTGLSMIRRTWAIAVRPEGMARSKLPSSGFGCELFPLVADCGSSVFPRGAQPSPWEDRWEVRRLSYTFVMRRVAFVCVLGLIATTVFAQDGSLKIGTNTWRLGDSKFVAERPDQVLWSPDGEDLAYTAARDGQTEVGLYSLKDNHSGVVANLVAGETVDDVVWLNAGHEMVLVTRQTVGTDDLLKVRVADASRMECRELWARTYPKTEQARIEVNESPTLAHALVTVSTEQGPTYFAITSNAGRMVLSTDIADAAKNGKPFAGWSATGTAIFGPKQSFSPSDKIKVSMASADDQGYEGSQATLQFAIQATTINSADGSETNLPLTFLSTGWKSMSKTLVPAFKPGETVLECMPANGGLRQIRFMGPYVWSRRQASAVRVFRRQDEPKMGALTAHVQSLWLVPPGEKAPSKGILISAQAEESYVAPKESAVAFLCHGSLFVRKIVRD